MIFLHLVDGLFVLTGSGST